MSLRGSVASLTKFAQTMRALPRVLAQEITAKAAPAITELARKTFEASEDAYGASWAPGAHGQRVTLRKSGDLARYLIYVAVGTKLRVALGTGYAKYQIGRRSVFPRQGEELPAAYMKKLAEIAQTTAKAILERGAP